MYHLIYLVIDTSFDSSLSLYIKKTSGKIEREKESESSSLRKRERSDKTKRDGNFSCPPGVWKLAHVENKSEEKAKSYPAPVNKYWSYVVVVKVDTEHTCYVPEPRPLGPSHRLQASPLRC